MRAVGDAQESFRPGAAGAQLIPEMSQLATNAYIADNQKLSGLAGNDLPHWLTSRGITTVFITGVATNLTVEQTARHGTDLGFTVYVTSDCVAAADEATPCGFARQPRADNGRLPDRRRRDGLVPGITPAFLLPDKTGDGIA